MQGTGWERQADAQRQRHEFLEGWSFVSSCWHGFDRGYLFVYIGCRASLNRFCAIMVRCMDTSYRDFVWTGKIIPSSAVGVHSPASVL